MTAYLSLPLSILYFWYIESPQTLIRYFGSLNASFLDITSLTLLLRTYFMPIKGEYRNGLVAFSIGMGIVLKGILIIVSLIGLAFLLALEAVILLLFLTMPVLAVFLLIK